MKDNLRKKISFLIEKLHNLIKLTNFLNTCKIDFFNIKKSRGSML